MPTSTPQPAQQPKIALHDMGPAPELTGITQWFNSEPLTLQQLRGKVVIVNFWTFDCINCRHTMPYVKALYSQVSQPGPRNRRSAYARSYRSSTCPTT